MCAGKMVLWRKLLKKCIEVGEEHFIYGIFTTKLNSKELKFCVVNVKY